MLMLQQPDELAPVAETAEVRTAPELKAPDVSSDPELSTPTEARTESQLVPPVAVPTVGGHEPELPSVTTKVDIPLRSIEVYTQVSTAVLIFHRHQSDIKISPSIMLFQGLISLNSTMVINLSRYQRIQN